MKTIILLTVLFFAAHSITFAQKIPKGAVISGKNLTFLKEGDTIKLVLFKFGEFDLNNLSESKQQVVVKNSSFKFHVLPDRSNYFILNFPGINTPNLYSYIISNGDNVVIQGNKSKLQFTGKGSQTFKLLQSLTEIDHSYNYKYKWKMDYMNENCALMDSSVIKQLSKLEVYRKTLSINNYLIIKGDILGKEESFKYAMLHYYFRAYPDSTDAFLLSMSRYKNEIFNKIEYARSKESSNSNFYTIGLLDQYRLDSCLLKGREFNLSVAYQFFKNNYSDSLRERIVSFLLYEEKENQLNNDIITDALQFIHNKNYRNVVLKLKNTYSAGANAFNFSLKDSLGITHTMNDYKGKVVVLDFWFTGCGACRKLSPILTLVEKDFISNDIAFISVSIDKTKSLWISSLKKFTYTSPYSINLFTNEKAMDNPIIHNYDIHDFPTLIIIDKNNKVTRSPISPLIDNGQDLRKIIISIL